MKTVLLSMVLSIFTMAYSAADTLVKDLPEQRTILKRGPSFSASSYYIIQFSPQYGGPTLADPCIHCFDHNRPSCQVSFWGGGGLYGVNFALEKKIRNSSRLYSIDKDTIDYSSFPVKGVGDYWELDFSNTEGWGTTATLYCYTPNSDLTLEDILTTLSDPQLVPELKVMPF